MEVDKASLKKSKLKPIKTLGFDWFNLQSIMWLMMILKILATIRKLFEVVNENNVNGVVSGGHTVNINSAP